MPISSAQSALKDFLSNSGSTLSRESLINNKLLFDLKLAAAKREYLLGAYLPEVDQDGFDFIFDDHDRIVKMQLKTTIQNATTSSWEIHKRLLRPAPEDVDRLNFERSPEGEGVGGGIILIEVCFENGFELKYFYTDIFLIYAIRKGLLEIADLPTSPQINRFFNNLQTGGGREKISVSSRMFFEANSPDALLGLMGIHCIFNNSSWRSNILDWSNITDKGEQNSVKELINNSLSQLTPRIESK